MSDQKPASAPESEELRLKPTTTMPTSVSERVCLAKQEIKAVPKSAFNKHGNYHHATVDDVYDAVRGILGKYDLDLKLDILELERATSDKGSVWIHAQASIGFVGEEPSTTYLSLPLNGPQAFEAMNSYLQKQYLRARLQIPTGEYAEQDSIAAEQQSAAEQPAVPPALINAGQLNTIKKALADGGRDPARFCKAMGVPNLSKLPADRFDEAMELIRVTVQQAERKAQEGTGGDT